MPTLSHSLWDLIGAYSIILVVASRIFRLWHVEPFIVSIWDLHCGMWNLHCSMHDLLVVTCRIFVFVACEVFLVAACGIFMCGMLYLYLQHVVYLVAA